MVSCWVPSVRVISPTKDWLTSATEMEPPVTSAGGHSPLQASEQLLVGGLFESLSKRQSVTSAALATMLARRGAEYVAISAAPAVLPVEPEP